MTYEEARNHFKEQLEVFGGEHHEAMKVAIEALELIQQQQKEIERLSNFVTEERCREIAKEYFQLIARQTRAGAVKEFAERLKENLIGWNTDPTDVEIEYTINNLVKEMVGASDDR